MAKERVLRVRMDGAFYDRVDALAVTQGLSVSALVRAALERAVQEASFGIRDLKAAWPEPRKTHDISEAELERIAARAVSINDAWRIWENESWWRVREYMVLGRDGLCRGEVQMSEQEAGEFRSGLLSGMKLELK